MHETDLDILERWIWAGHVLVTFAIWAVLFGAIGLLSLAIFTYLTSQ